MLEKGLEALGADVKKKHPVDVFLVCGSKATEKGAETGGLAYKKKGKTTRARSVAPNKRSHQWVRPFVMLEKGLEALGADEMLSKAKGSYYLDNKE